MNFKTFIAAILTAFCFSCSKNYNCVCHNPGGSEKVASYHTTKSKATKKCNDYYQENYGSIPWNETSCQIE